MDSEHQGVSKKLFPSREKAENAIPDFKKHIIRQSQEKSKGFFEFDPETVKCQVIDFELEES